MFSSKYGGNLASSLSAVELTIALHYVFDAPQDKILWDMGQQAIPHKILTGRRPKNHSDRLLGFTRRSESEYDCFGSGHVCNSISAGLGMAVARDLKGRPSHVVAVIEDGAMTAGQVYEALNNAGYLDSNMIVVLNDNSRQALPPHDFVDQQAPPVGTLTSTLSKIKSNSAFREIREAAKGVTKQLGGPVHEIAAKVDDCARGIMTGSGATLFAELGLYYIGPVDGHKISDLVTILREVKNTQVTGPVLIHAVTEKGRGDSSSRKEANHGQGPKDVQLGLCYQGKEGHIPQTYTHYFAEALINEALIDTNIVVVHAAMENATGLREFAKQFPDRCFDVGIAEQHAITFAAGMACEGLKPFCTIHSSFLQRAYDQVVHDVDLQKLPVRFAMDRAGLAGAQGPMHCGAFDVTYMACLPNMVVMAPSDESELIHMVATAAMIDDRPSCFRFPRGHGVGVNLPLNNKGRPLEIGRGRILIEGTQIALLGYGAMVHDCVAAHSLLAERGVSATIADARFCKPLDFELVRRLAKEHKVLITVEEGSIGGFGSHVVQFLALDGLLDGRLQWRPIVLPDRYIEHGSSNEQRAEAGLTATHIAATALKILGRTKDALQMMVLQA